VIAKHHARYVTVAKKIVQVEIAVTSSLWVNIEVDESVSDEDAMDMAIDQTKFDLTLVEQQGDESTIKEIYLEDFDVKNADATVACVIREHK
jgi:hypothetical protein